MQINWAGQLQLLFSIKQSFPNPDNAYFHKCMLRPATSVAEEDNIAYEKKTLEAGALYPAKAEYT